MHIISPLTLLPWFLFMCCNIEIYWSVAYAMYYRAISHCVTCIIYCDGMVVRFKACAGYCAIALFGGLFLVVVFDNVQNVRY